MGSSCVGRPGKEAVEAGATSADLLQVLKGVISPALRTCARTGGQRETSCAAPHELEWVGDWQPVSKASPAETCQSAAKRYTSNSLLDVNSPITSTVYQATDARGIKVFRCAVGVRDAVLISTLKLVGSGPLPIVSN